MSNDGSKCNQRVQTIIPYLSETHVICENTREIEPFQEHQPIDPILDSIKPRSFEIPSCVQWTYMLIGPDVYFNRHRQVIRRHLAVVEQLFEKVVAFRAVFYFRCFLVALNHRWSVSGWSLVQSYVHSMRSTWLAQQSNCLLLNECTNLDGSYI